MRPQSAKAGGRNRSNSPSKRDLGPTGDRGLEHVYSPRGKRRRPQGPHGGNQIFRGAVLPTDADIEGYRSAAHVNEAENVPQTMETSIDHVSHESSLTEQEVNRIKNKLDELKRELEGCNL